MAVRWVGGTHAVATFSSASTRLYKAELSTGGRTVGWGDNTEPGSESLALCCDRNTVPL